MLVISFDTGVKQAFFDNNVLSIAHGACKTSMFMLGDTV